MRFFVVPLPCGFLTGRTNRKGGLHAHRNRWLVGSCINLGLLHPAGEKGAAGEANRRLSSKTLAVLAVPATEQLMGVGSRRPWRAKLIDLPIGEGVNP